MQNKGFITVKNEKVDLLYVPLYDKSSWSIPFQLYLRAILKVCEIWGNFVKIDIYQYPLELKFESKILLLIHNTYNYDYLLNRFSVKTDSSSKFCFF